LEATVARGVHISWFPRQLDLEPGVVVWKEPGVPDEIPDAFRKAGEPLQVTVLVPRGDPETEQELEKVTLSGLYLPLGTAFSLLVLHEQKARGALPGDYEYFRQVALFVLGILARGRVIPMIEETRPLWRPFFASEHDRRAVQGLLQAMPSSLQVPASAGEVLLPPRALRAVQREILDEMADAGARAILGETAPRKGTKKPRSGPEAWIDGLARGDAGKVAADPTENQRLTLVLGTWKAAAVKEDGAFRTCFRLEPPVVAEDKARQAAIVTRDDWKDVNPEEEEKRKKEARERLIPLPAAPEWTLSFHLQARDDPSALVPAGEVWTSRTNVVQFLGRDMANPHERLLADLGRASRIFPPLEPALHSPTPDKATLTTDEAYQFLREAAGGFEEAGFGVIVPSWWQKEKGGNRLAARLKVQGGLMTADGKSYMDSESLLDFSWDVVLGENALDRKELEALAALKTPLVRVRGEWVELRKEDIDSAMKLFTQKGPVLGMADAVEVALGAGEEVLGLKVVGLDDRALPMGQFRELLSVLRNEPRPEKPPKTWNPEYPLRPYQELGLSWLDTLCGHSMGALLADDMGLGKTIQVLAYLEKERLAGNLSVPDKNDKKKRVPAPVLLLCPTSVLGNWRREAQKFVPQLKVLLHHGADRDKGKAFEKYASKFNLVVTSYGLALRDISTLRLVDWAGLVVDEAQNLKNPEAKQTQAVASLWSPRRIALTGTPVENRLSDLYSIMSILNPGLLGTEPAFRKRFAIPIERLREESATCKLRRLLRPFVLRREKTDPAIAPTLPKKTEVKAYCTLTPEQATLYKAVVEASLSDLKKRKAGLDRSGAVLGALTRLKQVCNHPAHFLKDGSDLGGRSGKLERLVELLEEVYATNDKALVFTQFKEMGDLLVKHLRAELGQEPIFLHGGVAQTRRDELVKQFQADGGPHVFVLSLKAGGTGLNLTRACHVFHFDRWWNPAVEDQATDRAFRIGQTRGVMVHKLVCQGTLEERLDEMLEAKKALARGIVGSGEGWITDLSDDQLAELMRLGNDAVEEES
jgi:SNF2 family DNA or RNA helicase